MSLKLVCREDNDLVGVLRQAGIAFRRYAGAAEALAEAGAGEGLLILAEGYPEQLTEVDAEVYASAAAKGVRLYVEFPAALPDGGVGEIRRAVWERVVVASEAFAPAVSPLQILMIHSCRFVTTTAAQPLLVSARVAGFDRALFGLPEQVWPLLFEHPRGDVLVATTKLSQLVTGRYAPAGAWAAIWRWILGWACPGLQVSELAFTPTVRPTYGAEEALPADAEAQAFRRGVAWYGAARLFIHPEWQEEAQHRLDTLPDGTGPGPDPAWPLGDGRSGMIEGASSAIHPDGTQDWRYYVRADCVSEVSMAMAAAGAILDDAEARRVAVGLTDYVYRHSIFAQGPRGDPASPSYGLLSWASKPPADGIYYGDDNARSMLGTLAAAALLGTDRWDEEVLRCLLANLRTTGPLGFRGGRLTETELEERGWRGYWETERMHYAPHYESWLWACFLWAYARTGFAPFLERAATGIRLTMAAYPDEWRWTNGIQQERARMLLALSWLVRVDDTPEHRAWLRSMAGELLRSQAGCGAIREELGVAGHGSYGAPACNEEYGTTEAPLIQENGDPLCDLLYTSNFALVGLHEAAAATGELLYVQAEDRLARFLCRIQVRSEAHPELDGGWFRAFDFGRWEYWASNADIGWGAWSIESGWTQAWITTVLALRQMGTSLWELTGGSRMGRHLDALLPVMLPDVASRGE